MRTEVLFTRDLYIRIPVGGGVLQLETSLQPRKAATEQSHYSPVAAEESPSQDTEGLAQAP